MWHHCSLLPPPWLLSCSSAMKNTPQEQISPLLKNHSRYLPPPQPPTISPECLSSIFGAGSLSSIFLPRQALRLQLGVEVGNLRASLVARSPLCHLSKSTAAHGDRLLDLHPSPGRCPEREMPVWGALFLVGSPPKQPCQALLQLCVLLSLAWARGVTRVMLGSHSLDSRHVWGRHGADFFGFLKGVLLVKGLLFLLLVLQRKEGHFSVGCRHSEGQLSHQEQWGMCRAALDAVAWGTEGALYFWCLGVAT